MLPVHRNAACLLESVEFTLRRVNLSCFLKLSGRMRTAVRILGSNAACPLESVATCQIPQLDSLEGKDGKARLLPPWPPGLPRPLCLSVPALQLTLEVSITPL